MPELPDITLYVEALDARIRGATLEGIRIANPFLLRTIEPPLSSAHGRRVVSIRRLGKRIVIELDHVRSRLLRDDWLRTIDELEERRRDR